MTNATRWLRKAVGELSPVPVFAASVWIGCCAGALHNGANIEQAISVASLATSAAFLVASVVNSVRF